jgi:hypothetical protein
MKKSRFTESQIVSILKEADAGIPVNEVWRKHGVSSATYYKWKARYGGLDVSELRRTRVDKGIRTYIRPATSAIGSETFRLISGGQSLEGRSASYLCDIRTSGNCSSALASCVALPPASLQSCVASPLSRGSTPLAAPAILRPQH